MNKLPISFYTRENVVIIAQELLGKKLVTTINGIKTSGIIVETEAYRGRGDRACHSNMGRRTKRTEIMYHEGGRAYVYLCYGVHHLFNIITNKKENADAVLIRAIEPKDGIEEMLARRKMDKLKYSITNGPGSMSKALGITTKHYGHSLLENKIWLEEVGVDIYKKDIIESTRVGVSYAGEDAKLPWRFRINENKWVSPAK